jgi:hypothetical protein
VFHVGVLFFRISGRHNIRDFTPKYVRGFKEELLMPSFISSSKEFPNQNFTNIIVSVRKALL